MLELLSKKSLDDIGMSELARKAHVSRSTLYLDYGNVHEVFADMVTDFRSEASPMMSYLECYEGVEPVGLAPFCIVLRPEKSKRNLINEPRFLSAFMGDGTILKDHVFYKSLISAGYYDTVAMALAVFQVNGCFNAVRNFDGDDEVWNEIRETIDTFICGGLNACKQKKGLTR